MRAFQICLNLAPIISSLHTSVVAKFCLAGVVMKGTMQSLYATMTGAAFFVRAVTMDLTALSKKSMVPSLTVIVKALGEDEPFV